MNRHTRFKGNATLCIIDNLENFTNFRNSNTHAQRFKALRSCKKTFDPNAFVASVTN